MADPLGKSLFLIYLLVMRMQNALPVAIHADSEGYFLLDKNGVTFHGVCDSEPLKTHEVIWCLTDSHADVLAPAQGFLRNTNTRIVQAASARRTRIHGWMKQHGGRRYIMDAWDEGEIATLAYVTRSLLYDQFV
jgi:hypothetical protein